MLQSKNNKNNAPWSELTYLVIFTIISILECFCSIFFCFVFSDKQKKRLVCWERIYIFLKIQCDIKSEVLKKRRTIFQERKLLNLNGKNLHRFSMVLIAGELNTALWYECRTELPVEKAWHQGGTAFGALTADMSYSMCGRKVAILAFWLYH